MLTLTCLRRSWSLPLSLVLLLLLFVPGREAVAAGRSYDVSYNQILVWTGLSDGGVHSLVAYKNGFQDERAHTPVVNFGPYGIDNNDVTLELTPVDAELPTWEDTVYDGNGNEMATVTVSYPPSTDVRVEVSAGLLQTESDYVHPQSPPAPAEPPQCRGYAWLLGYC